MLVHVVTTRSSGKRWAVWGALGAILTSASSCSGGDTSGSSGSSGSGPLATGGTTSGGVAAGGASSGGTTSSGGKTEGNASGAGGTSSGGSSSSGSAGTPINGGAGMAAGKATGGAVTGGGAGGPNTTGGSKASGGAATAGAATASGGAATAGVTGQGGGIVGTSGACTTGAWPTADPSKAGPFAVTTESNVGPQAGAGAEGEEPPRFTLVRPTDLAQSELCHPLITWGNGHGTTPSIYAALLKRFASHGFVVIASNSSTVSQGSPAPMLVGLTWVLEQNSDPTSKLYQRIDATHIGATGHSEGAMATATAGADSRVVTIAPICGGGNARSLHGPALLLCGGQDTTVPCSGSVSALKSITTYPGLVANYLTAGHNSWMTFGNGALSPIEVADVAWMRLQLMGDTALRSMFYGASCTLCADSAWQITQNSLAGQ